MKQLLGLTFLPGWRSQTDLHPGRNIYPTSWFKLSVLFLTGCEMFLVHIHVWDPPSHRPPPWQERLPDQAVHSDCIVFDRQCDVCGPYTCLGSPITRTSTLIGMSTWLAGSFCLCFFYRREEVCGSYMCLGSPVPWMSTPVLTSTWPASSFCLCCFWQSVRCLLSLHVSGIPRHTDHHCGRIVYPTSWFIVSVLFLTDGGTYVVPKHVQDPPLHRPPQTSTRVCPTGWFILSVLFLTGGEMSVIPTHDGISHQTDLHLGRNIYLTSWFILYVLFLRVGQMSHRPPPW